MKAVYTVNEKAAKLDSLDAFKKWRKYATPDDLMPAEERFVELGGKLPKAKKEE